MRQGNTKLHYRPQTVALASVTPAPLSSSPVASNAAPESLISYGKNDKLPNELLGLIMSSRTARACFNERAAYIIADGFKSRELSETELVPGKTADAILHDTAKRVSELSGIAWAVVLDRTGKPIDLKVLPFSCVRKRADGNFILNYGYQGEKKPKRSDDIFFYKWEKNLDPTTLAEQFAYLEAKGLGYEGHLYYKFDADPDLYNHYPLPRWYSEALVADIEADIAASFLDKNAIKNGFKAGYHLKLTGSQYASIETFDKDGKSLRVEDSPAMAAIKDSIKTLKDPETDASVLITVSPVAEEKVELDALEIGKAYSNGMTEVVNRQILKVCIGLAVHPVLVGMAEPGKLGGTQEMNEAAIRLANKVIPDQNMISRSFAEVFGPPPVGENWDLSSLAPKPELPLELFQFLGEEERKTYLARFV